MKYLKIFMSILCISSCTQIRDATCLEMANGYRADEINLILIKPSKSAFKFYIEGRSPVTNKRISFKATNYTWATDFNNMIDLGDTIVKKKGELKFYIHKKDTVLIFPFECDGEIIE